MSSSPSTTLDSPPPALPVHHMFLMATSYISMTLYIMIIIVICKHRKKHVQLQSAFYDLLFNQFFADFYMFLVIEILFRPRKYRLFPIFVPQEDSLFAKFSHFSVVTGRGILFLGYLPFALNRFTIYFRPILYQRLWNRRTVNICLFVQWAIPIIINSWAYFLTKSTVAFKLIPGGVLQMMCDSFLAYVDGMQAIVIGGLVTVVCGTLYAWTFKVAKEKKMPSHIANNEMRLLMCASITFIPMFLEAMRNIVQLVGFYAFGLLDVFVACTEVFFYTTELACVLQPWTILLTNRTIRRLLWPSAKPRNSVLISTISDNNRTPQHVSSIVEIKVRSIRRHTNQ